MPDRPDRTGSDMLLQADERAPSRARQALTDIAVGVPEEVVDRALLLLSEAVTNSVRHGTSAAEDAIGISIDVDHTRIHVDVADAAPLDSPLRPRGQHGMEGGLGLLLIDRMADRWGAAPLRTGKTVWFELDLPNGSR
jgi:anti-sigma regulatory factor (Ser/Thr protein kinase)